MYNQQILRAGVGLVLAEEITETGWLPPVRIADVPVVLPGIQAIAEGDGAAYQIEVWGCATGADAPDALWQCDPDLVATEKAEAPGAASEIYLLDAPLLWVRFRVVSLTGTLRIAGVI